MERSVWPKNLSSSRKRAILELLRGQNPTKKLRHLFDAHSQAGNNTRQPSFAEHLVVSVLRSFGDTRSESMSDETDESLQLPTDACIWSDDSDEESINTPVPRVLTEGCSDDRVIGPCLQWIKSADSQVNATVFLDNFYGRARLINLIKAGPPHFSPATFRSLLYEACARTINPIYGSVGLLWTGNWAQCQDAVAAVLEGSSHLMQHPSTDWGLTTAASQPLPALKAHDLCAWSEDSDEESISTLIPRKTSDTWPGLDQNLIDNCHQWRTYDQTSGCRVLPKGCSDDCVIRPCLQWIKSADSQANATVFLTEFYGHAGLLNLIKAGPPYLHPATFRSLIYEACGRIINPVYGSVGLLWSGNWGLCQAAVEDALMGSLLAGSTSFVEPN